MPTEITNYQCPACTGPLHFEAGTDTLCCEYCGSAFGLQEIEALYAQKEARAAEQFAKQEANGDPECEQIADGMRVYNCPSCGAQLMCDETTAATACPYCGNPSVVPGQFTGMRKPDHLIPFKLKKEAAVQAMKKHCEGKTLLPKAFKDENHLEELKGVYVPFWLYDCEADGETNYECTTESKHRAGDYEITETAHYKVYRAGNIELRQIPVDASSKMSDAYMDSLEPFQYDNLTDFSTAYLPGFLADTYDQDADACEERAKQRAEQTLANALKETAVGYRTVSERGREICVTRKDVSYALLPVWLLHTKWNGTDYLFAMNGQTGKFVGDLPIDKRKRRLIFAAVLAACLMLAGLGFALFGTPEELWEQAAVLALFPLLTAGIWVSVLTAKMKSVFFAREAAKYVTGELHLTGREDRYTHTTQTRRQIKQK